MATVREEGTGDPDGKHQSLAEDPVKYMSVLRGMQASCYNIQSRNMATETAMVQFLPVNERFNLNKEGKVMALWQERQRDWERVQQRVSTLIKARKRHNLMMTRTDEFRARMEEYDFLQVQYVLTCAMAYTCKHLVQQYNF